MPEKIIYVQIMFPVRNYEDALSDYHRADEWLIVTGVKKNKKEFRGQLVSPRFKGKKVNKESLSESFKARAGWQSWIDLTFTNPDLWNYLRDLKLPKGATLVKVNG